MFITRHFIKFSIFNIIIDDPQVPKEYYLLCNTATGETFLANKRLQQAIVTNNIDLLIEEEIQNFIEAGIILEDDEVDESLPYGYFHEREKYSSRTLNLTVLLTMACNLRCVYCYEAAGLISNESLNSETQRNLIDFIKIQIQSRKLEHLALWLFWRGTPSWY